MAMPTDVPIIDCMISFPIEDKKKLYEFITKQTKDSQSKDEYQFPVEYMFKDVPDENKSGEDPVAVTLREMDKHNIERGLIGIGSGNSERALKEHPDRFVAAISVDPNDIMGVLAPHRRGAREVGHPRRRHLPVRPVPADPHQRAADVPGLRQVRGARHPGVRERRRPRSASEDGPAEGGVHRRRDVRLPRPRVRDPSRVRAVGGPRGEAHAQVAGPALLHQRVRAQALPEGDHRLRQHARRRQDHLRRVTSRWGSPSTASWATWSTCRSATTCGRSS